MYIYLPSFVKVSSHAQWVQKGKVVEKQGGGHSFHLGPITRLDGFITEL